jgi:hypothetical protein
LLTPKLRVLAAAFSAAVAGVVAFADPIAANRAQSDLDGFMQKVLARRDENWKKLQQYVLDERELVEIRGPSKVPIWGSRREYSWYIREGFFVRSPVKADGVTISEDERRKAEDQYFRRVKARDQRDRARQQDPNAKPSEVVRLPDEAPKDFEALLTQTRQPEFVNSAYFLKFKFEEGKYALVGRESFEGQEVLRIEYYPARLFSHEQDKERQKRAAGRANRGDQMEAAMEKMMNKVSLVTIWVEPKAHQIVKYTFDNVNFDFLPAAWLVRVNDLKAQMTMSRPFKDVNDPDLWLPRDLDMFFGAMLAIGTFDVRFHLDYYDYKQASTSGRIKGAPER